MEESNPHEVIFINENSTRTDSHLLVGEEPFYIRMDNKLLYVTMRTPGYEAENAAGFLLGEGLVESFEDIEDIKFPEKGNYNVVDVILKPERREQALKNRGSSDSGFSGMAMAEKLHKSVPRFEDNTRIDMKNALKCLLELDKYQPLRDKTKATHASALFDADYNILSSAEDVGRHNGLDKAIGKLFIKNRLDRASFLILSSRISYELVQKAARAKISIICALSRPNALAVHTASGLNMTLISYARPDGLYVFCGEHRVTELGR